MIIDTTKAYAIFKFNVVRNTEDFFAIVSNVKEAMQWLKEYITIYQAITKDEWTIDDDEELELIEKELRDTGYTLAYYEIEICTLDQYCQNLTPKQTIEVERSRGDI